MSGEELQLIGRSLALHPPVMIITLCLFMYIRGKAIASSKPTKKVTPFFPFRDAWNIIFYSRQIINSLSNKIYPKGLVPFKGPTNKNSIAASVIATGKTQIDINLIPMNFIPPFPANASLVIV